MSSQIRKLEEATGRALVVRDTHSVTLTPDGEAMIGFASAILASCEQAERYFASSRPRGRVRLGLSDDLALTPLPAILRAFRADHPLIDIELTVDQSGTLHRRLERHQLDLVLGKRAADGALGALVKRDRLVWVGTPGTVLERGRPLPLVIYPTSSISRALMLDALERTNRTYSTACLCRGFNDLVAAVAAGIGIAAVAASLVPPSLTALGSSHGLPRLGHIDLVLVTNPRTEGRPSVEALTRTILGRGARILST